MITNYGLQSSDSCVEAASRILQWEYKLVVAATDAVFRQDDTTPLHDLRISIRKFRAATRFFSHCLRDTTAASIDQRFSGLSDVLSPARDRDAWLEYLTAPSIQARLADDDSFAQYLYDLKTERDQQLTVLRHSLKTHFDPAFRGAVDDLLYRQFGRLEARDESSNFHEFGRRRLGKYYQKVIQFERVKPSDAAELIHEFRKKCRRGRYWSEFSISVGGGAAKHLAKYFKNLATAIGTVRDMRLHLEKWQHSDRVFPKAFYRWHQQMERDAWHEVKVSWRKLTDAKTQRQVKAVLLQKNKL